MRRFDIAQALIAAMALASALVVDTGSIAADPGTRSHTRTNHPGLGDHIAAPRRVQTVHDVPATPPAAGRFRIHLIDVGTGLSILVQGHDFTLLYDGGSKDRAEAGSTTRTDDETRLLSYLFAALGPSGGCAPPGDVWPTVQARVRIDHLFLSHPHEDHGSMLDEVLRCYDVANVWDAGAVNDTAFYRAFVQAVAATHTHYHTDRAIPAARRVRFARGAIRVPPAVDWLHFAAGDTVALGSHARFRIVYASPAACSDPNNCSIVLRVELGATSLLLTGDTVSGSRAQPTTAPGRAEAAMLANSRDLIDADILQIGHHGSMTSSRRAFIEAVSPSLALLGAGPTRYSGVLLPDRVVPAMFAALHITVISTAVHDGATGCPADRVGADHGPGGCDNYVVDIDP